MNYTHYQAIEFAADESFQEYVLGKNPEAQAFWEKWIAAHPEKEPEVQQAILMLTQISFKTYKPEAVQLEKQYEYLKAHLLASHGQKKKSQGSKIQALWSPRWWVAASIILILAITTAILWPWSISEQWTTIQTPLGKKTEVILPDSSIAVLNSNSKLTYSNNWTEVDNHELWLEGEAFFDVKHMDSTMGQRFIVHAANSRVEVLGTQFNVRNRASELSVVLESGRVKLSVEDEHAFKLNEVIMNPGERAEVVAGEKIQVRKNIALGDFIRWKDNSLVFKDTPFGEVISLIENFYEMEVDVRISDLQGYKLNGTVPNQDLDLLLRALNEIYELKIEREENKIIIDQ